MFDKEQQKLIQDLEHKYKMQLDSFKFDLWEKADEEINREKFRLWDLKAESSKI